MRFLLKLTLSVLIFFVSATTWACDKKHSKKNIGQRAHHSRPHKHPTKHAKTQKKLKSNPSSASKIAKLKRQKKEETKRLMASLRAKRSNRLPPKYVSSKESQDEVLENAGRITTKREPSSENEEFPEPEIMLHDSSSSSEAVIPDSEEF